MSFFNEAQRNLSKIAGKALHPGILVGVIVLVVAILFVSFQVLFSALNKTEEFQVKNSKETISEEGASSESDQQKETIQVHVLGAVCNPGVYELESDSRLNDAIVLAGGLLESAETKSINLARHIEDGEQIYVMTVGEYEAGGNSNQSSSNQGTGTVSSSSLGASTQSSSNSSSQGLLGLININTASQNQLESLPGIGEATAKKIISYRQEHGSFSSPSDITKVSGVGDKKYEAIKDYICV